MTTKEEIGKLEEQLLTAIQKADTSRLDELLHEDLLFNLQDGQTITKQIDMDIYRSGGIQISKIKSTDQTIQIIGDNAVVAKTINLKGTYLNQPFEGTYRYLRVWKSVEGNWKVIGGGCHSIST